MLFFAHNRPFLPTTTSTGGYVLDWDGVLYNQEQQKSAQEMTMSLGP